MAVDDLRSLLSGVETLKSSISNSNHQSVTVSCAKNRPFDMLFRYLSHVMNVATPTKDCLELIFELLVHVMKARTERRLTIQEKSLLLDWETQMESLLALTLQNYKSLDENSSTGLLEILIPIPDTVAPALAPAVQLYTLIHDILSQDGQALLTCYLQAAARKRCRKHMVDTDEFVASNTDGFLIDSIAITTAYLKMKNLCIILSDEIKTDIKIHNQHILPSSISQLIYQASQQRFAAVRLTGFRCQPAGGPKTG